MSLVDRFLSTLSRRTPRSRVSARAETLPPLPRRAKPDWRRRLGAWLTTGLAESDPASQLPTWRSQPSKQSQLDAARAAFLATLDDVDPLLARVCLEQIGAARSLHELWHLRSPVYSLVSRRHTQGEANRRMTALDQLFSKRQRRQGKSTLKPRR